MKKRKKSLVTNFKNCLCFTCQKEFHYLRHWGDNSMPLCTKRQYENFETSYAHIFWKRNKSVILRYAEKIGTIKDLWIKQKKSKFRKSLKT